VRGGAQGEGRPQKRDSFFIYHAFYFSIERKKLARLFGGRLSNCALLLPHKGTIVVF
jgi:hypothetical protein